MWRRWTQEEAEAENERAAQTEGRRHHHSHYSCGRQRDAAFPPRHFPPFLRLPHFGSDDVVDDHSHHFCRLLQHSFAGGPPAIPTAAPPRVEEWRRGTKRARGKTFPPLPSEAPVRHRRRRRCPFFHWHGGWGGGEGGGRPRHRGQGTGWTSFWAFGTMGRQRDDFQPTHVCPCPSPPPRFAFRCFVWVAVRRSAHARPPLHFFLDLDDDDRHHHSGEAFQTPFLPHHPHFRSSRGVGEGVRCASNAARRRRWRRRWRRKVVAREGHGPPHSVFRRSRPK